MSASVSRAGGSGDGPAHWRAWLEQQGEWGATVSALDWSSTTLGPIEEWPLELRSAVSICVGSSIPMSVWWGRDLVVIPNWASREVLGQARFATALGRPFAEVWPDALPRIGSEINQVFDTGRPLFTVDSLARLDRTVAAEECYFTYGHTPITDGTGAVLGVLHVFVETTPQVLGRRRHRCLAELGAGLATAATEQDANDAAMTALARNIDDHPAGVLVTVDKATGDSTVLAGFGEPIGREPMDYLKPFLLAAVTPASADLEVRAGPDTTSAVGGWHVYRLGQTSASEVVLLLAHHRQLPFDADLERHFQLIASLLRTTTDIRNERAATQMALERARLADAAWRAAVLHSIHDPIVIFDRDGTVLELTEEFTALFGYSLDDGPIIPPFPWWPTEEEDPAGLAEIIAWHEDQVRHPRKVTAEFRFYTKDRRPLWIELHDSFIENGAGGGTTHIRSMLDLTRDKDAQQRRATAARLSAEFSTVDDLATLLSVAEHTFNLLFDGLTTIQLELDGSYYFRDGRLTAQEELPLAARAGLVGAPNPDTRSPRPGILLVAAASGARARAWIQFPLPRRITADEMIVADLLAQAFTLAVDRLTAAQEAADRQLHLEQAIHSHRLIGQAVGILVERHRILPAAAFDRLKAASQLRNEKLRDIALKVVETGAEPGDT